MPIAGTHPQGLRYSAKFKAGANAGQRQVNRFWMGGRGSRADYDTVLTRKRWRANLICNSFHPTSAQLN
jgi:hypothetical protein